MQSDFIYILQWWATLFFLGIIFFPLTKLLFKNPPDYFYIFSKILGILITSYTLLLLGTLRILPFNIYSVLFIILIAGIINFVILKKQNYFQKFSISKIIVFEEILFFVTLCAWSYVRAHEPSIQSLEKFMDYGFVNSILRSEYFPPKDIWFTPFSINYYYFGHLTTAFLTKLSSVPSNISYNLMLATLFSFAFTGAFSLLFNFLQKLGKRKSFLGGILGGILLSLSGNLHTIHSLFSPYIGEKPVPPWSLTFLPITFPNGYWYPNATRFIPFTIHEFPLYSFIVSDLHGHVLDIPFVLTVIALSYTILKNKTFTKLHITFISLLLAVLYMTNVWDGIIYLGLTSFVSLVIYTTILRFSLKKTNSKIVFPFIQHISHIKKYIIENIANIGIILILYVIFSLPFNIFFKPFVSGIGIICAPDFLTDIGKVGPFLFEKDHCQKSEPYQLFILYGFFLFFSFAFIAYLIKNTKKIFLHDPKSKLYKLAFPKDVTNIFIILLIFISSLLILAPEFLYAKDIYPAHYRANTMFKLAYQAFIMFTLASAYSIVFLLSQIKSRLIKFVFLLFTFFLLVSVLIYPYFAISSYYGDLKTHKGLDGTAYIKTLNPDDLEAITFLNTHVRGQPVILEAQGDSYTNYARISANTGLPTILGWTVHEWLWRGSYDIPAPRIAEVKIMYEGEIAEAIPLFKKYNVAYVIVGNEEKNTYTINPEVLRTLGTVIFKGSQEKTLIYKLTY